MATRVIGSVFEGRERDGDFAWMIAQTGFGDALFVFNDNEEQFLAFRNKPGDPFGCGAGGGNAVIRPYRCSSPPRAAGVPTGTLAGGGYAALTNEVRQIVDDAIELVRRLVETGRYPRVFYSAADESGTLGTGIFDVGEDVKRYIVDRLVDLEG
jgi:hypothetical protein